MKSVHVLPLPFYKTLFVLLCVALVICLWNEFDLGLGVDVDEDLVLSKLDNVTEAATTHKVCNVNLVDRRAHLGSPPHRNLTVIYYVTPTYPRPNQVPELTRLSHSLMHVPGLHWVVANDHDACDPRVHSILQRSGLPFTHISSPKPPQLNLLRLMPRGVTNRRAALRWITSEPRQGVLYFGDDDNSVDLDLFDEIRKTRKLSMFPVGLISEYGVSSPVLQGGKVIGFFDSWPGARRFAVDMAGFAVNLQHLAPAAAMPYKAGFEEDGFLKSNGFTLEDVEPLADNCTRVLVWHTRSVIPKKKQLKVHLDSDRLDKFDNLRTLLTTVRDMNMAGLSPDQGISPSVYNNRFSEGLA
ncbi:hypothetical protein JYU34_000809 [Plutella xylostella]|uniref:Galactosylgalactosylxylosylprotein 3-beta-glucuronosyltransferase n=2 Tax=Plutella xylostella TaxID=51655 RepID=A0ABQ7R8N5_PLUXY|nr:galactosylgalactosylxylosylprotein 3-beta-glucuronosyltransferase S isoform X1 [Plutella xylostella]KAG7313650.1 hypothetical protein JYU34_000809 [Plutella xylostella]